MTRLALLGCILLPGFTLLSGCAGRSTPEGPGSCSPPRPESVMVDDVEDLVGRYSLMFVATSGHTRGRRAEGRLELWSRPEEYRPVLMLDLTPDPTATEPLYGVTTVDLGAVGGPTEGSLSSADPEAPGVVLRVEDDGTGARMTLLFGSARNRRDTWILDGAGVEARVVEVREGGLSGWWHAYSAPTDYHVEGYFCARRPGRAR